MPMDERKTQSHALSLENREKMTLSGVVDVESFDEDSMVIETNMGTVLLSGSGMHILKYNVDGGELVIEGEIDAFEYSDAVSGKKGWFARIFG